MQVEVFEVSIALSVRLARHIQNVSHSRFDQFARFESALKRSHIDSTIDLEQADVSDSFLAVHIARAKVNVRESATDDLLFISIIGRSVVVLTSSSLLLPDTTTSESGVHLHSLELGDRDHVWILKFLRWAAAFRILSLIPVHFLLDYLVVLLLMKALAAFLRHAFAYYLV